MKNLLNTVQVKNPNRNGFDLTHDVKLSCNMGQLIPIMCTKTVPGDSFNISSEALIRFAPLVSPMMHRVDVSIHYFFVPNRILWPGWEKYIVGDSTAPAYPTIRVGPAGAGVYVPTKGSLADYMGIPPVALNPGAVQNHLISAFPFAAYQACFNEYYRDQNLVAAIPYELANGDNTAAAAALLTLRNRAWEHDYFTAALPFAQKGNAVNIPLGGVELNPDWPSLGDQPHYVDDGNVPIPNGAWLKEDAGATLVDTVNGNPGAYDPGSSLRVSGTTITDLRRAYRLQEWLEKNARGGSRYVESILVHFGVRSSDARLNRPEYITGMKTPVQISEVLNTTGDTLPQGNMSGHAVSFTSGSNGNYFCEEHGYILGIMSVMPKTAYMQGIPKHFLTVADFTQEFWPEFAHIGEQDITQKEIYAYSNTPDQVFGYIPRYAEYKFENNRVAGDFRDSLDFWHMGRKFATAPQLNSAFITSDPTHRVFAVTDPNEHKLYCQVLNIIRSGRPMPKYGTPQM